MRHAQDLECLNSGGMAGGFRLTRVGSTVTSYVKSATGWRALPSFTAASPPGAVFGFGLWTPGEQWAHQAASVAFDNFQLTSGTLLCPDWWRSTAADWQPLARDSLAQLSH